MAVWRRVRSLCPECLRVVDARYAPDGEGTVHLEKRCPEHGVFRTPAWAAEGGAPPFDAWRNDAPPSYPRFPAAGGGRGCPFDCGLCPDHAQNTCCALIEVTRRCDMRCPLCYASAGGAGPDPSLAELEARLAALRTRGGRANVQLSGGEPAVRDDLPEIIALARHKGFPFVQLNTNGLRLAREPGYAGRLREAGLNLVYLQWDGLREETFKFLRGAPYLADKELAARHCAEAGLPVVLVATVVRGVNDDELGGLLRRALDFGPRLRGLHLQPAASFGRYPWSGPAAPRLTLPELMLALEKQSGGLVKTSHFRPPRSEHALCSFSALYQRTEDGRLKPVAGGGCCRAPRHDEARRARDFVARHWSGGAAAPPDRRERPDDLDDFLAVSSLRERFTLSAMAFQDAYSLDLERVRRCHVHVVSPEGRLVPFCLYNLTSAAGVPLYREG